MPDKRIAFLLITLLIYGCGYQEQPAVLIKTELGNIKVELYHKQAPISTTNFLAYVDSGLFDGGEFYRTVHQKNQGTHPVKIDVIQGGLGWSDSIPRLSAIEHESTKQTGILHKNGVISMARNKPGTASSEFFITIGQQPELDYGGQRNKDGQGFAAFGRVIEGMEVVHRIHEHPDTNQFFPEPVKIISISRVGN